MDDRPANPLGRPPQADPQIPAAAPLEPSAPANGSEPHGEPPPSPRSAVDATVGTLVATVDQLQAEVETLRKQTRSNSRNLIMLFGAVVYVTYLARKGALENVANSIPR